MNRFKQMNKMNHLSRYILIMTFLTAGLIALLGFVSFILQLVILVVMTGLTAFCAWFCLCSLLSKSRQGVACTYAPEAITIAPERQPEAITQAIPPPAGYPDIMPLIKKSRMIALYGTQGSGKTSLLLNVVNQRRHEQIKIVDPHGFAGKYPFGEIIGAGRNYQEINDFLESVIEMIDERYKHYKGQVFDPLNIFIDELTLLHEHCTDFKNFMKILLTESRKVGFRAVVCTHSNRAAYLGLKGGYDLSSDLVFISLKNDESGYYAMVGGNRYSVPPPPVIRTGSAPVKPVEPLVISQSAPLNRVETPQEPESESDKIRRIYAELTAANGGAAPSMNAVCREAFGKKNPQLFYRVKTALTDKKRN